MMAATFYRAWREGVDEHLRKFYCITIEDAGFDEEYLLAHWRSEQTPLEFVRWFGKKYDLDRLPPSLL